MTNYLTPKNEKMLDDSDAFVVFEDGTYAPVGQCIIVRIPKDMVDEAVERADGLSHGFADDIIWSQFSCDSIVDIEQAYRITANYMAGQEYTMNTEPW
jgi:hypothetical protein